ncbi:MAG: undecaprenyl-diphosphate phosphatase [bacterium]
MDIFDALILGIVQGVTEFIPVSSSAHLVIVPELLQIAKPSLSFDTMLHFGTFLSLMLIYWKDILKLIRACGEISNDIFFKREFKSVQNDDYKRLVFLIILTTIPACLVGILLEDYVEALFKSPLAVGFFLLGTGFILAIGQRNLNGKKDILNMTVQDALFIGVAQALALAPGISRSGITITAGLYRGLNKDLAPNYAFLIALPVILGATILQLKDVEIESLYLFIIGVLSAFISGYLAIKVLLKIVKQGKLIIFAGYCWIIGLIMILWEIYK